MQGPLKALHLHGETVAICRVLHRLCEEWSADGHLIIFISAAGGEMIGVAQLAAFLEVMVMVDVVLHKALVPVIPLALCWNSLPFCIGPVLLFVLFPAVNMSYIEEQLVPAINCLPGDFCVPAALGSGEHEDACDQSRAACEGPVPSGGDSLSRYDRAIVLHVLRLFILILLVRLGCQHTVCWRVPAALPRGADGGADGVRGLPQRHPAGRRISVPVHRLVHCTAHGALSVAYNPGDLLLTVKRMLCSATLFTVAVSSTSVSAT